jgi:hypothetical protein
MMVEGNKVALALKEEPFPMISAVIEKLEQHNWYADIIYYLKNLTSLNHLADHKRRALR